METSIRPARHKLSVADCYRMAEAGILGEDDRVELIEGALIDMAPIGSGHAAILNRIVETLVLACAGRAIVSTQNPVRLDDHNEPQPDCMVLRSRTDFYEDGHPGPNDVCLLIEVSDSSLRFDRTVKLPLYARAGIVEVWIVDLTQRTLDVHRLPRDGAYAQVSTHRAGDTINLAAAPDIALRVDQVFG